MIDAKELRIGNYAKLGERIEYVYQIIYDRTSGYSGKYSINHKDYNEEFFEPIELTEDILIKCGNKKDDEWIYLDDNYRVISAPVTHLVNFSISYFDDTAEDGTLIGWLVISFPKYLHQLQNLYFCLCGKELEITL